LSKDTCWYREIFAFFIDRVNLCFFVITSRTFSLSRKLSEESKIPSVRPTIAMITQEWDDVHHHLVGLSTKHKTSSYGRDKLPQNLIATFL